MVEGEVFQLGINGRLRVCKDPKTVNACQILAKGGGGLLEPYLCQSIVFGQVRCLEKASNAAVTSMGAFRCRNVGCDSFRTLEYT